MAMNARNAISMAATLIARRVPSEAPAAKASITLTCSRSTTIFTLPTVAGVPVSGSRIFDRYNPHGAAITLVVSTATGSAPRLM